MTDILWYPYECEIICRTQTAAERRFEKEGIFMLETGIRGRQSVAVTPENTAKTMGSGTLNVLMLAAHAVGLGSCWINRAREEFEQPEWKAWLKSLGIEGDYEGIGHLALGYPDSEPHAPKARKECVVKV